MKILPGMLAAGLLASTLYPCQTQAQGPVPAAPSGLMASSVSGSASSSQLDSRWIDNATNENGFDLQFATNESFTGATTIPLAGQNLFRYSHTGRDPITTYWYRIRAKRGALASAWSDPPAFATTAPNDVAATAVSSSAIDVHWTPTANNTNISGYTVRYSTDGGSCQSRPVTGMGRATYLATGLVPRTTYKVSVRADDDGGPYSSGFSARANATTSSDGLSGKRISPLFFGQNAWLPDRIGGEDKDGDLEKLLCGASYNAPGDPCVPSEVFQSGVKLMRYGGKTVDRYYVPDESAADENKSSAQYLTMVDNMRANGIEPLLEVPYWDGDYSEGDATELVRYINITHDRCVRYWTIANEPNKEYNEGVYNLDAAGIARYFKRYVTAMRNVDPTIIIVGPDLSEYDGTIMSKLLTDTTGTGAPTASNICGKYLGADGKMHYYLDVVAFHIYPFPDEDPASPGNFITQTGQQVIAQPSDAVNSFKAKLEALDTLVKACNDTADRKGASAGTSALKMAVTEINVEFLNPTDLSPSGVSAQSFLAGQYWADVMNVGMQNGLEFMAFWSVKEGGPKLGYITGNDNTKLPTYYHYEMLAQNFRGVDRGHAAKSKRSHQPYLHRTGY